MGSSEEQIIENRDTSRAHTETQFEAVVVPFLAGAVAPLCPNELAMPSSPEEFADGNRCSVYDEDFFQLNAQPEQQKEPEVFNVTAHVSPTQPQARLRRQVSKVEPVMATSVAQDGRFTSQTTQIGQQHQLDDQTVAVRRRPAWSLLWPRMMLAEYLNFAKQHLASLLMQDIIGHTLTPFQFGGLRFLSPQACTKLSAGSSLYKVTFE